MTSDGAPFAACTRPRTAGPPFPRHPMRPGSVPLQCGGWSNNTGFESGWSIDLITDESGITYTGGTLTLSTDADTLEGNAASAFPKLASANTFTADNKFDNGILTIKETTTPSAVTNYGKVYTKSDNKLYFQDGAGAEHEFAFV